MSSHLDDTGRVDVLVHSIPYATASQQYLATKRMLDLVLATLLLVLTAPILLLAMALVRLTSRGPAIYVQNRVGHHCEVFKMYKLRTMVSDAESLEEELRQRQPRRRFFKLEDDPRVTPVGRFLRKSSLDELPQLLNVIRGEMSLVGPRPLLESDFQRYPRGQQLRRFSMQPGLTGLWQVSGRSRTSDDERLRLDLEYVDHWSLDLDVRILIRTPAAVVSGRGAT